MLENRQKIVKIPSFPLFFSVTGSTQTHGDK